MDNQKKLWNLLAIIMVAMLSIGLSSCGDDDDDDKDGGNSDLVGYWVKEAHLNNPARNGSGGTVTSYGYQFLSNGTVYVFQLHHTGLSSRYSYAEANTSWERLTERNGVSFYINPDKKLKTYRRVGNEVYIDITDNPTIMSMIGSDRMEAISLDGWAEGTYIRVNSSTNNNNNNNNNNITNNEDDNSKYDIVGIWKGSIQHSYGKETIVLTITRDEKLSFTQTVEGKEPYNGQGTWEYNQSKQMWYFLTSYSVVSGDYSFVGQQLVHRDWDDTWIYTKQ